MSKKNLFFVFLASLASSLAYGTALLGQAAKPHESQHVKEYLEFVKKNPELFDHLGASKKNEIEIVLNPERIAKIEKQAALRMQADGYSESETKLWSSIGIVAEDYYWIWIRDAVIFPSGVYGTYDRLMWKNGPDGVPSIAILPLLPNKKIVLNVTYRHATRSWEIELPRGWKKPGETVEYAAMRSLKEETGYLTNSCTLLGTMAPDTGVLMSIIPIYYSFVKHSGEMEKKFCKAIVNNPAFTKEEVKAGFVKGYMDIVINGESIHVNCRDPYLTFALLQAEMKGVL